MDLFDNHTGKIVKDLLKKFGRKVLKHPPYSLDLSPSDYHLFRSLSRKLLDKKNSNTRRKSKFFQNF